MANLIMSVESPAPEGGSRRKPARSFRGRRRTLIRKLKKYAEAVQRSDMREIVRGQELEYNPATFTNTDVREQALKAVIARCGSALDQTV